MKRLALVTIQSYWRLVPMPVRDVLSAGQGTSVPTYLAIESGEGGLGLFLKASLPLRKLGKAFGVYDGPHNW
jgi:hypothetical protein